MKTKGIPIILFLTLVDASCFGQQTTPRPEATALTVIIDIGPLCRPHLPSFCTLTRQAVLTLQPGDYLEIIAARTNRPTLKLAQTIRTAGAEEIRSIDAALATTRAQFLSNASVAKALGMALWRLDETCRKKNITRVMAIVFSDGQIAGADAQRVLELADEFKKRGWSLYVTGTMNTNKDLLVGANKGRFTWSLIEEAQPAIWLQNNDSGRATGAMPTLPPLLGTNVPTGPILTGPTSAPDGVTGMHYETTQQGPGYQVTVDTKIKVAQQPGDAALLQGLVVEPNEPSRPLTASALEASPKTTSERSRWTRLKELPSRYWWLVLPLAVVLAGMIWITIHGTREARRLAEKTEGYLAAGPARHIGILMVRWGEQSYELGSLDRFRSSSIGPGSKNTIRIPGTTTTDQHLRLYKKGPDLMVKNVAPSPCRVNGLEVKPGHKLRLVVPAVIQLNDHTKLHLEIVRPPATTPQKESDTHEQSIDLPTGNESVLSQ
jgi:hypothetical protein